MAGRSATPLDYWLLGMRTARIMVEAQVVISLRLLGLAGAWPVAPSEATRMIHEKGPAFLRAAGNATASAMKGRRPDQIAGAGLRPIGEKTRTNARRLAKRSPR
jgi:hypothetical protein